MYCSQLNNYNCQKGQEKRDNYHEMHFSLLSSRRDIAFQQPTQLAPIYKINLGMIVRYIQIMNPNFYWSGSIPHSH